MSKGYKKDGTLAGKVFQKGKRASSVTEFKNGQHNSFNTEFKKGNVPWNKGLKLSYNPHYKHRGFIPWNKDKKWSDKIKEKISKSHMGIHSGSKHPNWQGGKSFEPYAIGWTKTYKEQIRYRDGYICQICGVPEVECAKKLHVHHRDYNKKNIEPDNLISLCNSCHSKTNYNKEYWTEYFNTEKYHAVL